METKTELTKLDPHSSDEHLYMNPNVSVCITEQVFVIKAANL